MKSSYWVLIGIGLLAVVCVLVLAAPGASAWHTGNQCPASGDWTVSTTTKYYDEWVNVNGNLYVNSDLTLTNVGIRMNTASTDGGVKINVASGGSLTVYSSAITSNNGAYHYKFTVYGTLNINMSGVSEMWGDTSSWAGGIQLYSNNTKIANSSIYNGKTGGIYISKCNAWIYNNAIYNNGGSGSSTYCYGIYALGDGTTKTNISSNNIYRNTLYQYWENWYGYGIRSEYQNTSDVIENNNIYDNGFNSYGYYCQGTQLYLYYSNPTIRNNKLTNGQYQLYAYYSDPPVIKRGTISGFAYYYNTVYGVYADHSGLSFENITFTTSYMGYDQAGIYATSYSQINVTDCTFDYRDYGWYRTADIYVESYTPVNVLRCKFLNDNDDIYSIYAYDNCPVNITGSEFTNYYGTWRAVIASSASPVNIRTTSFTSYYASSVYAIQVSSSSPLTMNGCKIFISDVSGGDIYGVQASSSSTVAINGTTFDMIYCYGGWSIYGVYADSSEVVLSNFTANIDSLNGYYYYFIQMYSSDLTINDSVINDYNNQVNYYYYLIEMGWSSGDLFINNLTIYVERTGGQRWYGTYLIDGGNAQKVEIRGLDATVRASNYLYCIYFNYADILIENSRFDISSTGEGVYILQGYRCDMTIRRSAFYLEYAPSDYSYGYIFESYTWDETRTFLMENSSVQVVALTTSFNKGSVQVFSSMNSVAMTVRNCTIDLQNTVGFYDLRLLNIWDCRLADFINTTINATYGYGSSTNTPWVPLTYYGRTETMNFTGCSINIYLVDEPVKLDTFYFEQGCGDFTLNNTKIRWDVDAPNSAASMVTMYEDNYGNSGGLESLSIIKSKLTMDVKEPNAAVSVLKLTSSTPIGEIGVAESEITLNFQVASDLPTYAIQISGSDLTISGLTLNLNAPAGSDTVLVGVLVESASPVLKDITVQGNGNGRICGIVGSLAATPFVQDSRISNAYIGIGGDYFAALSGVNVTVENCAIGVGLTNYCNFTFSESSIKGKVAVGLNETSRTNLVDCRIQGSVSDFDLTGASIAWLLNCSFDPARAAFHDGASQLIVNWKLQLKIEWQNGKRIPGADVVITNAKGQEFLRASSSEEGIVPYFIVVEYIKNLTTVNSFSPYLVKVSYGGLSGEQSVVTDRSKEETIRVNDDSPPVLVVSEPPDGRIQNSDVVALLGTAADVGSGIDYLSFSYDGLTWNNITAARLWMHVMDVPEGGWQLRVRLFDIAGNSATVELGIVIDLTRPAIEVSSPANRSLGNKIGVDLIGRVEAGSTFTINYRPVEVAANGDFVYGLRLVEGRNDFLLFARDRAGNTNSTSWTLFLDITPPPLKLARPADGFLTNQERVTVEGSTEPGAQVTVSEQPVEVRPDGSFSVELTLRPGANLILVTALDAAGNNATQIRNVLMDDEMRLDILSPADGLVTSEVTILVQGMTDGDALLRLNDGLVTVEPDGNFSVTFTLYEGLNTLTFSAVDLAGNARSLTRTVRLDTVPPVVEMDSPARGSVLKNRQVTVSGRVEPGANLTVNGNGVATDTGLFSTVLNLDEGTFNIAVEARDAAGNTVSFQIPVTVDLTAPALDIIEPLDGFRTLEDSVRVVGITEPGAAVTVNGLPAVVDKFGKFTVQLTVMKGKNTITATSTDAAGNGNTESITVSVTGQPSPAQESTWQWTAIGLLLALGIMVPLTMLLVNSYVRMRIKKEGAR